MDEKSLREDQLCHALEIPKLSIMEYERSSRKMCALYNAFADGLNYFLMRNSQIHPRLLINLSRGILSLLFDSSTFIRSSFPMRA
jgi:acyl-homoserine lactone acylase PvdQ